MKHNAIETITGGAVIAIAALFLSFSAQKADVKSANGYLISAAFTDVGGLSIGDNVQISGVKVGTIQDIELDTKRFLALVHMNVDSHIKLSEDTSAVISSASLLGGRYLALQPGGMDDYLLEGDVIETTQAPQNLEQLLGKFIFNMQKDEK
jgi:phospholipid/cholesterol/gamma-HCH transport system substrate-binding protein